MPKPLSNEQLDSLQANGVIVPGQEAATTSPVPAGLLLRTLGRTGLPHSETVARFDDEPDNPGVPGSLPESLGSSGIQESYLSSHNEATRIMALVNQAVPRFDHSDFLSQLKRLKPTFELMTQQGLAPEISLSPANRPLSFWEELASAIESSQLNPTQPGSNEKVLRNGGLWVADSVKAEWNKVTNPTNQPPSWRLEVISGLDKPRIVDITGYGYVDKDNKEPSHELNQLLQSLGKAPLPDRSSKRSKPQLTQPDIHPGPENYIMHQLSRIIQNKSPLDGSTYSWLRGVLASGSVLGGRWNEDDGQVDVYWNYPGDRHESVGARPSGRG